VTDPWIGRTLSKVKIERLIGRGGMADVYVGVHTTLNVQRAVKILQGHLAEDDDLLRRFREEAKAVSGLSRHANIVQVYDLDLVDGQPYIIMELLSGLSMSAYLKELHQLGHSLPLETVSRLLNGLASALDFAHSQGIVHRDVKPANVILRQGATPLSASIPLPPDCEPVLTDFGIARIRGATTQTLTGTVLGTPAYMSPEQVRGETVDARSDNYSLGIMLYEMLEGALPFDPEVDTTASVLYKQANVTPPPMANTSPSVQAIVDRALQKDRSARYQKAGDLASAFRQVARAGASTTVIRPPASASPAPTSAPAPPAEQRRGIRPLWLRIAGIAGVVVLLGALGLSALSGGGPSSATPRPSEIVAGTSTPATNIAEPIATSAPPVEAATVPGGAIYLDSSLQAIIAEVPPPDADEHYAAWLIGPDMPFQSAEAQFSQGGLSVTFVEPQGRNLLALYDQFAISREPSPDPAPEVPNPTLYFSQAPEAILLEIRRLDDFTRGAPTTASIADGLRTQADIHDKHLGFSLTSIAGNDIAGAKGHAEHCINVLAGEGSPEYGDYDGNGRPDNPGDGYGLLAYLRLAQELAQSELANPALSDDRAANLHSLVDQLTETIQLAEDSLSVAKQIASADTIDELRLLADVWGTQLVQERSSLEANQIEELGLRLWLPIQQSP